jgi:hypothetical protein
LFATGVVEWAAVEFVGWDALPLVDDLSAAIGLLVLTFPDSPEVMVDGILILLVELIQRHLLTKL